MRSVAGLRLELDLAVGLEANERAADESLKVNTAGDVGMIILNTAFDCLKSLQSDAASLLKYLENSELLSGLFDRTPADINTSEADGQSDDSVSWSAVNLI